MSSVDLHSSLKVFVPKNRCKVIWIYQLCIRSI